MSNKEIPLERSSGVQVRVAEGRDIQQEYASVGRNVPPAKEIHHRKCPFVFFRDGSVGQTHCVIGSTGFMMFSRSNQGMSAPLVSDDYGIQEARGIIGRTCTTSIVMTETVVQKGRAQPGRGVNRPGPAVRLGGVCERGWQALPVDSHWFRRRLET